MNGTGGFLVDSVDECATRISELLQDRDLARSLGQTGRANMSGSTFCCHG